MPVLIRDSHLEQQIEREKLRRGDGTMAKTLGDLARERLMELERDGVYEVAPAGQSESK